ncbi:MAG: hypothetical protein COC15_01415 [Legionellales bacterium]|nr:MAG: hypothetical protein COC15_01415 [Legionellales bacterium]
MTFPSFQAKPVTTKKKIINLFKKKFKAENFCFSERKINLGKKTYLNYIRTYGMNHPYIDMIFKDEASKAYCKENLSCIKAINKLFLLLLGNKAQVSNLDIKSFQEKIQISDIKNIKKMYGNIYKIYCDNKAAKQISLPSDLKAVLADNIKDISVKNSSAADKLEICIQIINNLHDVKKETVKDLMQQVKLKGKLEKMLVDLYVLGICKELYQNDNIYSLDNDIHKKQVADISLFKKVVTCVNDCLKFKNYILLDFGKYASKHKFVVSFHKKLLEKFKCLEVSNKENNSKLANK